MSQRPKPRPDLLEHQECAAETNNDAELGMKNKTKDPIKKSNF